MRLVAVAGGGLDALVVASGRRLLAYRLDTHERVAEAPLERLAVELAVCPLDPSVVAVASVHHVMVYALTPSGFEKTHEVELMLELLGSEIFVLAVAWVPQSVLALAVVCNAFVKLYDVTMDLFSPYLCFTPGDDDAFASAVFAVRDDDPVGVFALASGRLALMSLAVDGGDGPIAARTFIRSALPLPRAPALSASDDLFFVAAQDAPLLVARLADVVRGDAAPVAWARIDAPERIAWAFFGADGARHFFVNPARGSLMAVDFRDDEFAASLLNHADAPAAASIFEARVASLSAWQAGADVFALSPATGRAMRLAPAAPDATDATDDATGARPLDVPAHLWTFSELSARAIEVTLPALRRDAAQLLRGQRLIFDHALPQKVLRVQSTSPDQLIVGVRVAVGSGAPSHVPPWITVNGRQVTVEGPRAFCFALARDEVRPRAVVTVEVGSNGGYDINVDDLKVFVVDRAAVAGEGEDAHGWFADGQSVFDFSDESDGEGARGGDIRLQLMERCSRVAAQGEGALGGEEFRAALAIVYADPEVSVNARRLALKCVAQTDQAVAQWAEVAREAVRHRKVHRDCWEALWRDITLMPEGIRNAILPHVWEAEPAITGPFPVVAAFLGNELL
jgi:hypothetical protein